MTIFKNGLGDIVAYLPRVIVADPASVDYPKTDQSQATYDDLCGDIIRGCDIGIDRLRKMREDYEQRRVMAAMGVPPVFDVTKG